MKDIKSAIVNIHDKTTIKISIHSSLVIMRLETHRAML